MKRIFPLVLLTLLPLTSCAAAESPPMSEALKISTYVYPTPIIQSDFTNQSSDNDQTLIELENLSIGSEYLLPRVGSYDNINNINLFLEYDGQIEIISESKDSQLSVDEKQALWNYTGFTGRYFGYNLTLNGSGWIAVLPLGFCTGPHSIDDISVDPYEGFKPDSNESVITINALDGTGRILITARLILRSVEQNLCTIELLSYDYSDAYKLMEAEQ